MLNHFNKELKNITESIKVEYKLVNSTEHIPLSMFSYFSLFDTHNIRKSGSYIREELLKSIVIYHI